MAVAEHHQVAVKSGHKVGKSLLVAILALWWAACWPQGKVLITAPSSDQIRDIVWSELCGLVLKAAQIGKVPFPEPATDPSTGMRWPDGRRIIGRATDRPERIQGYSGPACLYLIDEASGFARNLYEALVGNTAGGSATDDAAVAKFVLTGNPTQTTGIFHDAFTRQREHWQCFTISSEDTPNARENRVVIPGLATRDWVEKQADVYGRDSDMFRVRALGQFPTQGSNAVVGVADIDAAIERGKTAQPNEADLLHIGVDVARFGDDDSVIVPRRGNYIYPLRVHHGMDVTEVAGLVMACVRELKTTTRFERPVVKVDVIGIGAGVADVLRHEPDIAVVDVNVAEVSTDTERWPRLRDELWFGLSNFLSEGGALPDDEMLAGELGAPTYKPDVRGRMVVEPKEVTKKTLGRSPDRADGVALSLYDTQVDTDLMVFGGRYS
ncbi:MAG: hypothetical protein GVY18_07655 [Bacteroidetes bacterium]|nr:hypothetical protein [Bacteroidota bacterium]